MPELRIKDMPADVHQKLKTRAAQNRRNITKETLYLLEKALLEETPPPAPPVPFQGKFLLTNEWIDQAKRERFT